MKSLGLRAWKYTSQSYKKNTSYIKTPFKYRDRERGKKIQTENKTLGEQKTLVQVFYSE